MLEKIVIYVENNLADLANQKAIAEYRIGLERGSIVKEIYRKRVITMDERIYRLNQLLKLVNIIESVNFNLKTNLYRLIYSIRYWLIEYETTDEMKSKNQLRLKHDAMAYLREYAKKDRRGRFTTIFSNDPNKSYQEKVEIAVKLKNARF